MKKFSCYALFLVLGMSLISAKSPAGEKFTVKEVGTFYFCSLPCKGSFENMEKNMGLLFQYLQAQNIAPTGPMLGIYYNDPETTKPEDLSWEIGFPVGEASVLEPLKLKQWTFTTVVEGIHTGPYEESGAMYGEIMAWIAANGYDVAGPVLEKYLSDPSTTKPQDLKTEIWVPVVKK